MIYTDFTIVNISEDSVDKDDFIAYKNNVVYFYSDCNRYSIFKLKEILLGIKKKKYKSVELVITSWGGHHYSIYSFIKTLNMKINCYVDGYCASAATMILLAGTNRYMAEDSLILIHSHQIKIAEIGEIKRQGTEYDDYIETKNKNDLLRQVYERETTIPSQELDLMLSYQERWLTPKECLQYSIINEIKTFTYS